MGKMEGVFNDLFTFLPHDEKDDKATDFIQPIYKNINKKFGCNECTFFARNKCDLKEHTEAVHEKIVRFQCSLCGFKAYFRKRIKYHQIRKHFGKDCSIIDIHCKFCEEGGSHENCEKVKKNTKIYNFYCNLCDYKSVYYYSAKSHLTKHIDEKAKVKQVKENLQFSCSKCKYSSNTRLHIHLPQKSK